MTARPNIVEQVPNTPRTDANWRNGSLSYDLSRDKALAEGGDEAAAARLRTRRRLEQGRFSRGPAA